jgi:hypothetical protein
MMRSSRLGLFAFLSVLVFTGSSCTYYNQVMTRKDLVDGSEAYKNRKFPEAEAFFRSAVARDPKGETLEGKTAQLFLARTLHSEYIGNRSFAFTEADFLGEQGLALTQKLWAKADPLSQYLYGQLSPDTISQYQVYLDPNTPDVAPPVAANAEGEARALPAKTKTDVRKSHLSHLATDLNKVINSGQSIYDPARFGRVTLSDFTKQYMAQPNLTPDKIIRVNRLLLEDAYPGEIQRRPKAEDAIAEYQKALALNPADQSSYKAIASLYENLQRSDDWLKWVTARSQNMGIPPEQRAEALTSLAAKKNTCANEITDTEETKKTVTEGGKQVFKFVKPANAEDFEKLKQCVAEGMTLIDQAIALEPADVKNAASFDVKGATDQQIAQKLDLLKVFESARSYKASLLFQTMRVAEMEGQTAERDRLKTEAEAARASFLSLSDVVKKINDEIEERKAIKEAEATGGNKVVANDANKK